ncbi:protein Dr1 [Podarcis lilfordi]|uniref:Protein Dr1 n=1 Tax=Podarcis lilfordi TaxID=74358 RepID=A0AA35P8C2_9SAUR|nr:protein Dr1 [Podarcis lilfordi]
MASSSGNDDDLTIPRAAINKMIKETLPNVRVANDARELVVNCCTEFIHLISSEANEICNKSEKKTISPEHVIQALESLGFGSYISEVKEVLQECKTVALKRRRANNRLENLGIPEEELLRQQQELFAKARQQQAELAQQEWLQMQQAAQQAQLAAASASASNQAEFRLIFYCICTFWTTMLITLTWVSAATGLPRRHASGVECMETGIFGCGIPTLVTGKRTRSMLRAQKEIANNQRRSST